MYGACIVMYILYLCVCDLCDCGGEIDVAAGGGIG